MDNVLAKDWQYIFLLDLWTFLSTQMHNLKKQGKAYYTCWFTLCVCVCGGGWGWGGVGGQVLVKYWKNF